MPEELTIKILKIIKKIPKGRVATYGQVAMLAGNPRAARQVMRILHIYGEKEKLPWFRIINKLGKISIPDEHGYQLQKAHLENEGIVFKINDIVDLEKYGWVC